MRLWGHAPILLFNTQIHVFLGGETHINSISIEQDVPCLPAQRDNKNQPD